MNSNASYEGTAKRWRTKSAFNCGPVENGLATGVQHAAETLENHLGHNRSW